MCFCVNAWNPCERPGDVHEYQEYDLLCEKLRIFARNDSGFRKEIKQPLFYKKPDARNDRCCVFAQRTHSAGSLVRPPPIFLFLILVASAPRRTQRGTELSSMVLVLSQFSLVELHYGNSEFHIRS